MSLQQFAGWHPVRVVRLSPGTPVLQQTMVAPSRWNPGGGGYQIESGRLASLATGGRSFLLAGLEPPFVRVTPAERSGLWLTETTGGSIQPWTSVSLPVLERRYLAMTVRRSGAAGW
jgi:hypothetical protein